MRITPITYAMPSEDPMFIWPLCSSRGFADVRWTICDLLAHSHQTRHPAIDELTIPYARRLGP